MIYFAHATGFKMLIIIISSNNYLSEVSVFWAAEAVKSWVSYLKFVIIKVRMVKKRKHGFN